MEHTALMALALIGFDNPESRSALPNAPIVDDGRARGRRVTRVRVWLASTLHRLAWACEPEPRLVPETAP